MQTSSQREQNYKGFAVVVKPDSTQSVVWMDKYNWPSCRAFLSETIVLILPWQHDRFKHCSSTVSSYYLSDILLY